MFGTVLGAPPGISKGSVIREESHPHWALEGQGDSKNQGRGRTTQGSLVPKALNRVGQGA